MVHEKKPKQKMSMKNIEGCQTVRLMMEVDQAENYKAEKAIIIND